MNGRFSRQPCSSSVARISSPLLTSTHSPAFRFKEFWQHISGWAFSLLVGFFVDAYWREHSEICPICPQTLSLHSNRVRELRATIHRRVQTIIRRKRDRGTPRTHLTRDAIPNSRIWVRPLSNHQARKYPFVRR